MSDPAGLEADDVAARYMRSHYGGDELRLLHPHIRRFLEVVCRADTTGVDIGSGVTWLSIDIARRGAKVCYLDVGEAIAAQVASAVAAASLGSLVTVEEGDARRLRFETESLAFALSYNVGCTLDTEGLRRHIAEMARVLESGGRGLITTPSSLEQVFMTDGDRDAGLAELRTTYLYYVHAPAELAAKLAELHNVHRATLVFRGGRAEVIDGEVLPEGTPIYRKVPGLVVPNVWHDMVTYETAIAAAGLRVVARHADLVTSSQRFAYNHGNYGTPGGTLGKMYERHPAFTAYVVEKP